MMGERTVIQEALFYEFSLERHVPSDHPVFDKSERRDGTFERADFGYDCDRDLYTCPGAKELRLYRCHFAAPRDGVDNEGFMRYRTSKRLRRLCPQAALLSQGAGARFSAQFTKAPAT